MRKEIAEVCIKVAEYAAKKVVVKASPWNHYQNVETEAVRNWSINSLKGKTYTNQ